MRNIIVGIDPGTTVGYAIIDKNKKLIKTDSLKNISINDVIEIIRKYGNVVLVGCDKSKVPKFIEKFAIKFNARVVKPKNDLTIDEKRKLSDNFRYRNKHEMDAIASAVFAYNKTKEFFDSVRRFVKKEKAFDYEDKIIEIVLRKGITIKRAYNSIQET